MVVVSVTALQEKPSPPRTTKLFTFIDFQLEAIKPGHFIVRQSLNDKTWRFEYRYQVQLDPRKYLGIRGNPLDLIDESDEGLTRFQQQERHGLVFLKIPGRNDDFFDKEKIDNNIEKHVQREECSQCKNRTEYYCRTCKQDLCVPCKEEHVIDFDTKHHDVVIDRLKYGDIMLLQTCEGHTNMDCIRSDFRSCQTEISKLQENMMFKAKRLNDQIDETIEDIRKIKPYLNSIQKRQRRHIRSIQTRLHSLSKEINKDNVFNFLGGIQTTETRKRQARSEQLFQVISQPMVQKTFTVKPKSVLDDASFHISCVTPNLAWVSNWNHLKLIDTACYNVFFLIDKYKNDGVHTVTKEGNLVYIDKSYKIKKLSLNYKEISSVIRIPKPWKPYCLYCSPLNGDFLIVMKQNPYKAMVARYNSEGRKLQHGPNYNLYVSPRYITENQNGDVIVSDFYVITVTDSLGTHRFSYKGDPQASEFSPNGICTDALSHILFCEAYTKTVQMIDKDGQFLAVLLTEEQGIEYPYSLSYDHKSHLLWVGSLRSSTVCIYRHIERHEFLKDN
ncbi:uncharacterized protein LOC134272929 [Saccostrea cucullata]|uniref:uncharacterized protein LOC134272929 n=1 Tax=Saccostrea cuccullata TaxID=36930 RepID=UPI002ED1AC13